MKKILIPTDFSNCADYAAQYAMEIAMKLNCRLEFLHVIVTPFDWIKIPLEDEKLHPDILDRIRKAKNEFAILEAKCKANRVEANSSLVFDVGVENISSYINLPDYELIILGSKGSSGIKEKLMGSNAQKVIRNSSVPVLILKNELPKDPLNIVFVSDFEDLTHKAFKSMTNFADKINAKTHLLYVSTNITEDIARVKSKMDEVLIICDRNEKCSKNVIDAETIEQGIIDFSIKENIDMVCICTHGKNGLKQLFSSSVTEHIANHLELPLLSIKL